MYKEIPVPIVEGDGHSWPGPGRARSTRIGDVLQRHDVAAGVLEGLHLQGELRRSRVRHVVRMPGAVARLRDAVIHEDRRACTACDTRASREWMEQGQRCEAVESQEVVNGRGSSSTLPRYASAATMAPRLETTVTGRGRAHAQLENTLHVSGNGTRRLANRPPVEPLRFWGHVLVGFHRAPVVIYPAMSQGT